MRIRTVLCATALAALAAFPLAGVAAAQQPTDRDCRDFASQAAAQSALRSRSGDAARLDGNHNGIACEEYFRTALPAPPRDGAAPPVAPVVAAAPAAAADAPVRTVPERQILVKPRGAADTGDGSALGSDALPPALLAGGLAAAGAAGVLVVRRRAGRR
jgi:hypothetical protein